MLPVSRVKQPSVRDGHTSSLGGFQSQRDTLTRTAVKLVTRLFAFVSFNETGRQLTWMNIPWLDSAIRHLRVDYSSHGQSLPFSDVLCRP